MSQPLRARYGEARLPRYTSYPTAPHFSPAISGQDYGEWLRTLRPGTLTSLYVHVPFCRAMCWYCGCHTTVATRRGPIESYLGALRREIEIVGEHLATSLPVGHVHFGGGTPTILAGRELQDLLADLRGCFALQPEAEIAIEIDPRTLEPSMAEALAAAGVNRASLGVQSFEPAVQAAINRRQTVAETAQAAAALRRAGVGRLNFDLIYGLPHQTVASCEETVARCLELEPSRFSVFGYAHVPSFKKHQRKIDEAALPGGEARAEQEDAIGEALVRAGYVRVGLDHYARPDDPMAQARGAGRLRRNFQGYTTDPCDVLLAFGASAIGRLPGGYVQNEPALPRYNGRIARGELPVARGCVLSREDRLRADLIERVMCDFAVDIGSVCADHGVSATDFLRNLPRLRGLEDDGVIRLDGSVMRVPEEMRSLVRAAASAFDAYLDATPRIHSRAL